MSDTLVDIKELRAERARLTGEMQRMHREAEGRTDAPGKFSAEENEKFDRMLDDEKSLRERIDRAEAIKGLNIRNTEPVVETRETSKEVERRAILASDEYNEGFDKFLRTGRPTEQMVELRTDMLTTSSTHGGYLVPISFADRVISAKVQAVAVRKTKASVFNTSNGQALPVPVQSAYGVAAYMTEGSAPSNVDDTGAKVTLNAFTLIRNTGVSLQLLADSAFPVEQVLAGNIANSFAAKEDPEFLTGAGTTAITGVTGVNVGKQLASNAVITYAELNEWYFSVPPQYRASAEFVMADYLMAQILGLEDDNHRPIWTASTVPGEADMLMNRPAYTSVNFASVADNAICGVFGDWANGYGIRDVGGVTVLRSDDRLIDQLEVLFVAYERVDGNILDAGALKSLKFAAS